MAKLIDTVSEKNKSSSYRHPEKRNRPDTPVLRKPEWIRVKAPVSKGYAATRSIVKEQNLVTVCEEAGCPNVGECWEQKHATMMIMGDTCTRACSFCNVKTGLPSALDPTEPGRVASAVAKMGLKHVVITSVDRDDLRDGGAAHFAEVVREARALNTDLTVEILVPDFRGKMDAALEALSAHVPDVLNHNMESVPRLYPFVRPGADYHWSLNLLYQFKRLHPEVVTKSGLMVGLGETKDELIEVMKDLRANGVDMLTIGQYLQPTKHHLAVERYVTPEEFKEYETLGLEMGFTNVASGPMVRSSYHADMQASGEPVGFAGGN